MTSQGVRYQPIAASASEAPRPLAWGSPAVYHWRDRSSVGLEIKTNKIAREMVMPRRSVFTSVSLLVLLGLLAGAHDAAAQTIAPALTGKVTAEQGALEGVLVSAKKSGSTITITVVSDKDGRYAFPAARLEPGQYSLRIRAVGYDLDHSSPVTVAADKTATADLTLRKTEDLASQLSNAEWLASMPGTDRQKGQLLNCVGCHTLERPLRSKFSADEFMNVILPRMQGYVNQSIPQHPQLRKAERLMEDARRSARPGLPRQRRIPGQHKPEFACAMEFRTQDAAAPERRGHSRHLYRIRFAARDDLAA